MQRKRADVTLVARGLFASRAKAREAIEAGLVCVDGELLRKPGALIADGAHIEADHPYRWVSRGGVKLEAALERFVIDPAGLVCLDIGASTGGFTHVLADRGAARIHAVDVGHGQLHPSIAALSQVVALEGADARTLDASMFAAPPQLAVIDVSFISLKLVLPAVMGLMADAAALVMLIKPQFEVGRARIARGVVRDPQMHAEVCADIAAFVELHEWRVANIAPSPIVGGDGNREFLLCALRGAPAFVGA